MKNIRLLLVLFLAPLCAPALSAAIDTPKGKPRAVLVTGASSGLGLRMTEVLSKNGFIVYAGARKPADLKRLEAMENVESIRLDVTIQEDIDAAVAIVEKKGRGLFGLINNAGIAVFGPVTEVSVEDLEYQMNVNVLGPYRVTQAFAPMIIKSKGRIATTGSIAGLLSGSMYGPYGMSKHAVEAFTDSLAAEMARYDVLVSVIEPGNFASNIGNTARKRIVDSGSWPKETRYKQEREYILQRLSQVIEGNDPLPVAQAALDIMASDTPKRRYMVSPTQKQADDTIRAMLYRTLQANQEQEFTFSEAELIELLKQENVKLNPEQ